jgi:hypothetical protein
MSKNEEIKELEERVSELETKIASVESTTSFTRHANRVLIDSLLRVLENPEDPKVLEDVKEELRNIS